MTTSSLPEAAVLTAEDAEPLSSPRPRSYLAVACLSCLLGGCAALTVPPVVPPARLPCRLVVEFTSCLPELYFVLSGPAQSYERFRLNDRFRSGLSGLAGAKSTEASARTAWLTVHLDQFATGYWEIGAERTLPAHAPRVALAAAPGTRGSPATFSLADLTGEWGDRDVSIPSEIHKKASATLTLAVRFSPDSEIRQDTILAEYEEVITRDGYDRWAYEYGPVLEALVRQVLERIDRFLDEAARAQPPE